MKNELLPDLINAVVPELVSDIIKHFAIRYASDTPLEGPLKTIGFIPEDFSDQLSRYLTGSLELFFGRHPQYKVDGIADLFISPAISHIIESQLSAGEALNPDRIRALYKENIDKDFEAKQIFRGAKFDVFNLVEDFLACFREVLASEQTPDGILTRMKVSQSEQRIIEQIQSQSSQSSKYDLANALVEEGLKRLEKVLVRDARKLLEDIRLDWESGRTEPAISTIREFRSDYARWAVLSEVDRAEYLRTEAAIRLQSGETRADVQDLIDEAQQLAPEADATFLTALLAYREGDRQKALEILNNPQDHLSYNLKAGILLELNDLDNAEVVLNKVVSPNPNTLRLKALVALARRNLDMARTFVDQAMNLAPESLDIRFIAAQVRYFESISPYGIPGFLQTFPELTSGSMVKGNSSSLASLREAEKMFLSLTTDAGEPIRTFACVWRLACLASDPDRFSEANQYCGELLDTDPSQPSVFIWAVARHLDIDFDNSKRALRGLISENQARIQHILALIVCLQASDEIEEMLEVLQIHEQMFRQEQMTEVWLFHYVEALVRLNDFDYAKFLLNEANESEETKTHLESLILEAEAHKTGNWTGFLEYLEEAYLTTDDPTHLLIACEIRHRIADWEGILGVSDILTERIPTDHVFRMMINAAYSSRKFAQTLVLIQKYRLFHQEILPEDARHVQADCLYQTGAFKESFIVAKALKENNDSVPNLLLFADIAIKTGALHTALVLASEIEARSDIGAWPRLSIARIVGGKDLELARRLWRQAMENLPNEALLNAFMVANALGLKEETGPIFERLQQLPPELEGQFQMVPTEELLSISQRVREEQTDVFQKYNSGALPIHKTISQSHVTLAELYHLYLGKNEANSLPLRQFALFARHGGRPEIQGLTSNVLKGQVHLDMTAMLLAAHLGLLDMVEALFAPLTIPAELVPQLVEMYCRLEERDLAQLQARQQIVDLAHENISVVSLDWEKEINPALAAQLGLEWAVQYETVHENDGFFVNFLPLRKRGLTQEHALVTEDVMQKLIDIRSVLDALYQPAGILTHEQYQRKIQELGTLAPKSALGVPQKGDVLYFFANTLEVLAELDLLQPACQLFDIHITQQQLDEAQEFIERNKETENLASWVYDLIGRVHRGMIDGTYLVLPFHFREGEAPGLERSSDLVLDCLLSLLKVAKQPNRVVWIDDRYANTIIGHNGTWVLSIVDILGLLLSEDHLDEDAYYQYLRRLRAANVRFLPLTAQEILHHLRSAPIRDSSIDETLGLKIIRQYTAACMSWSEVLQVPPLADNALNKDGEVLFVNQLYQAVLATILSIWRETEDVEDAQVRSEWVLNYLYLDYAALIQDVGATSWVALLKNLLLSGAGLESRSVANSPSTLRQSFLSWLWARVLRPRIMTESSLMTELATELKLHLIQLKEEGIEGAPSELILLAMQSFLEDVPLAIREMIVQDEAFTKAISIDFVLTLGGVQIARKPLIEAVELTINGTYASVKTIEGRELELIKHEAGDFVVYLNELETGTRIGQLPPTYQVLSHDNALCKEMLLQNNASFDMSNTAFEPWIEKVIQMEPKARFKEVERALEESAPVFYMNLHNRLADDQPVSFEELLMLESDSLLRFLRLENQTGLTFTQNLEQAAQNLIEQYGIGQALWRLSCLPVPLPSNLLATIECLPASERAGVIERFARTAISPTAKIHLLSFLNSFDSDSERFNDIATWFASEDGFLYFTAFSTILRWVTDEFERRTDIYQLPIPLGLAITWLHANQIFSIFISVNRDKTIDLESFAKQFMPRRPRLLRKFFEDDSYSLDVAYPWQTGYLTFLLAGLTFARQAVALSTEDTSLREEISARLQHESPVKWELSRPIQRIVSSAPNAMNSFLGKDPYSLIPTLFDQPASQENPTNPLEMTQMILGMIEEQNTPENWLQCHMLLGDWPLLDECKDQFVRVVLETDFAQLSREDPGSSYVALLVAVTQARYIENGELFNHLHDQIIQIAQDISVIHQRKMRKTEAGEIPRTEILVDVIVRFARVQPPEDSEESVVSNYVNFVKEVVTNCSYLGFDALRFSQYLYDELPISQAQLLMPLILWLRAN